jgi:hypothetical protein
MHELALVALLLLLLALLPLPSICVHAIRLYASSFVSVSVRVCANWCALYCTVIRVALLRDVCVQYA